MKNTKQTRAASAAIGTHIGWCAVFALGERSGPEFHEPDEFKRILVDSVRQLFRVGYDHPVDPAIEAFAKVLSLYGSPTRNNLLEEIRLGSIT